LDNGTFEFNLQAAPGRNYRVEASDNLTTWMTIANVAGSSSGIVVRDTNAPSTRHFYRAVTP